MSIIYNGLITPIVTFCTGLSYLWYWPMVTFGIALLEAIHPV